MTDVRLFLRAIGATLFLGALGGAAGPALADQVFADDLIVQGSTCTGLDCINNENFGFSTFILKENNLRIFFNDTSTTSGFPANKWTLIANDSAAGGDNYFSLEDTTAARTPFRVDAGAPADSLRVASSGNIGVGSNSPMMRLQLKRNDTPGIRLEQDNTGGYTAQTWDIAGNEANFFVRDVTGGSRLPFRIRPGAPTSSIDIGPTGRVGISNASATAPLQVTASATNVGANAVAILANNATGPVAVGFQPLSATNTLVWSIFAKDANTFDIYRFGGPVLFKLTGTGDLTLNGKIFTSGPTCTAGCDAVLDPDFKVPTIAEHSAEMYKDGYLPAVGPTTSDQPIDLTDKLSRVLNELETAHIYIDRLNKRIDALEAELADKKG